MTKPTDHLPMAHASHSPSILSIPVDPRPTLSAAADEPAADLKGHFNTL